MECTDCKTELENGNFAQIHITASGEAAKKMAVKEGESLQIVNLCLKCWDKFSNGKPVLQTN